MCYTFAAFSLDSLSKAIHNRQKAINGTHEFFFSDSAFFLLVSNDSNVEMPLRTAVLFAVFDSFHSSDKLKSLTEKNQQAPFNHYS